MTSIASIANGNASDKPASDSKMLGSDCYGTIKKDETRFGLGAFQPEGSQQDDQRIVYNDLGRLSLSIFA
jgi:hypothetical protein